MPRLASIAYVVIGVVVASPRRLWPSGQLSQPLSAVVATTLWPSILRGANLHLSVAHL
jgi:hypothetical protein